MGWSRRTKRKIVKIVLAMVLLVAIGFLALAVLQEKPPTIQNHLPPELEAKIANLPYASAIKIVDVQKALIERRLKAEKIGAEFGLLYVVNSVPNPFRYATSPHIPEGTVNFQGLTSSKALNQACVEKIWAWGEKSFSLECLYSNFLLYRLTGNQELKYTLRLAVAAGAVVALNTHRSDVDENTIFVCICSTDKDIVSFLIKGTTKPRA